ncbi:MAG: BlaI/MecI/CopY family transcriptional regulator [Clostridia bacterium]|nr:BlaI/MecI/CopY family transcriptional regulator [Clostridia bacterium]
MSRKVEGFMKLPESELEIMQIIWDLDRKGVEPIHTGVIYKDYSDVVGRLKLTTVLTLITRLAAKGYIAIEKNGRFNSYKPKMDEDTYNKLAAADFVATVYKNDTKSLLSALLGNGDITEEDILELRAQIKNGENSKTEE